MMQGPNPEVQQPPLGASSLRIPLAGRRLAAAGAGSPAPETYALLSELPPIFPVPEATDAQRERLRRAIKSYRDETP